MICSLASTRRSVFSAIRAGLVALAGLLLCAEPAVAAPGVGSSEVAAASTPVDATPLPAADLDRFLARFAAMPGLSARFREEKTMALLAAPLINEGMIYFDPPGHLARHTTAPIASRVIIDGEHLTFGDRGGVEAIRLAENPLLGVFVRSFVKIFAGDREALLAMYALELSGDPAAAWTLRLRPRLSPMDQVIAGIELRGHELALERMIVDEVAGDRTVTTFSEVNTSRRFTPRERAELFLIDPKVARGGRAAR